MTKIKHQILRSKRRLATMRVCQSTHKQCYSRREAKRAARKVSAVAAASGDHRPLEVYHCADCSAYHIGHRRVEP